MACCNMPYQHGAAGYAVMTKPCGRNLLVSPGHAVKGQRCRANADLSAAG